jgi:hypothetical protein
MIKVPKDRFRSAGGGFTLTELIVAMGMAMLLLFVILSMLGTGGRGYSAAMGRVDANVEARAALTTLADDVAGVRFDENFGFVKEGGPWSSSELWLMTMKPRSAQESGKASGDLCFVHYYTAVTQELEEDAGRFSRKLYRRLVSSADVMRDLKDGKTFESPTADPKRLEDEPMAFNVVQFLVEPMVRQEGRENTLWKKGDGRPDYLDVSLRVTDNETAGLLTAEADWEGGGGLAERLVGENEEGQNGKRVREYQVVVPIHGAGNE